MKKILFLSLFMMTSYSFADNYIVGKLAPEKMVTIRSEVNGVVDSFNVDNGDNVSLRSPLLSISEKDYLLNINLAKYDLDVKKAELEMQEKQLQRYQSLFKKKGISEGDFENQFRLTQIGRAQYNMSKTQYEIAKRVLNKSTPDAPFDGVVTLRSVEVGQFISVGDPLYAIADLSKLKVRFHLLESDFEQFQKGDSVKVTIPSLEKNLTGIVTLFSPLMQENDPGFLVEVTLDNTGNLHPGMEAYVYFNQSEDGL
ncbi:efflux RND transporter periplasmic adaptor subunit [Aliivibrio salmonicida]|uniref:efflux RND transporter periplasmic adaptor subunit n=1 Tax=Aliivibrio salmonicida TaxID=40269 RepID=UPI00406D03A9